MTAPALPEDVERALPTRGDVGRIESTRDPVFLLRWRPKKVGPHRERWHVEGVWFTREEAERFAETHAYRWGSDRHGPCWQVYCVPADGELARLLKAVTLRAIAAHVAPPVSASFEEALASLDVENDYAPDRGTTYAIVGLDDVRAAHAEAVRVAVEEEREACAKECEDTSRHLDDNRDMGYGAESCAAAIRARGAKS